MLSGFTRHERNALVFLMALFCAGTGWMGFERWQSSRSFYVAGQSPAGNSAMAATGPIRDKTPLAAEVSGTSASATGLIDLNTADEILLDSLPGIGPAKARDIVEYRRNAGGFNSVYELDRVKGIGPSVLSKIAPLVMVGAMNQGQAAPAPQLAQTSPPPIPAVTSTPMPPAQIPAVMLPVAAVAPLMSVPGPSSKAAKIEATGPVNINSATMEELMTLKNIGEVKARAIILNRQMNGAFPSVDALDRVKGIGPAIIGANRHRIIVH